MAWSREVLERLKAHSTPTICNAIEEFALRPRHLGFMGPGIRCLFPELEPMVGYAVTLRIRAAEEPPAPPPPRAAFWEFVRQQPEPRVVVVEDLDPTPVGSYWGEVQANLHQALGCVGTVTNGGVRDLDEVRALGFHCFASCVLVSHAYVHIVDFGGPVRVGGLVVRCGDLLHGDKHGVTTVPEEAVPELDAAVQRVAAREARIIAASRRRPLDLDALQAAFR
jgi:regulator of RNase E activity RraA